MAGERILAIGTIKEGSVQLRVAPLAANDSLVLAAISFGRRLYEAGASRSACISQDEEAGWLEAEYEAAMAQDVMDYEADVLPPLQQFIDAAAELEDLIEGRDDEDFWRSGCW